ncbi:SDR family NAD(P)-dependent oxidoreductase [Streptomyces boninensis]|uniref:SDR family NAD(P)-dependent oxidoreductase n=1 Tax=Streptomyces boninensis TaxID=2039455 RepID=UPI003B21B57A
MATVVMTGGTSGFGAIAARRMLAVGDVRLILGARDTTGAGERIGVDLTSLDAVRTFADEVRDRLDGGDAGSAEGIAALVLNAGLIRPDADGRTPDGYETTFAVNHLAHYLLLRLLLPALAPGAVVLLTTSGTHDPATKASLVTPRHAEAELLAYPERDPGLDTRPAKAGQHAYTASKLCAVLTVRALQSRPEAGERQVSALAYDPGQVFGTGLAQHLALPLRLAWSLLGTPAGAPMRRFSPTLNSRAAAGNTLAELALDRGSRPPGGAYAALRRGHLTWTTEPSLQARSDKAAQALWQDSARLVGLAD